MAMGYPQFWAVTDFASALEAFARIEGLRWFVAGMLPIRWPIPSTSQHGKLSPDVYVVPGKDPRPLTSYNLEEEGVFPPFVLEVLSPSSVARDVEHKRSVYEALGGREYALFAPTADLGQPPLQGWKRGDSGTFAVWEPDETGRLFSDVLGLYLVAEGMDLRAETPTGRRLLTLEEAELTLEEAEKTIQQQQRELDRLRAELERRSLE